MNENINAGNHGISTSALSVSREITPRDLLYTLAKHWVAILLIVIICTTICAFYLSFFAAPIYESTSSLYIISTGNGLSQLQNLQLGLNMTADYSALLKSDPLLEATIKELGIQESYPDTDALKGAVSISNPEGTRIVAITVKSTDAQMAADIANELCRQAIIQLPEITKTPAPSILAEARVAKTPLNSSYTTPLFMTALASGLAGYLLFLMLFMLRDSVSDADDLARITDMYPLAVVPEEKHRSSSDTRRKDK